MSLTLDAWGNALERPSGATTPTGWRADPVARVRERLGEDVWSEQAEIMRAVAHNRSSQSRAATASAKTHLLSGLVLRFLDIHPIDQTMVVTTALTSHQVRGDERGADERPPPGPSRPILSVPP